MCEREQRAERRTFVLRASSCFFWFLNKKIYTQEQGIMNGELGRRYRNIVLAPGGEVDSMQSLEQFLGRAPNQHAFLLHNGLVAA